MTKEGTDRAKLAGLVALRVIIFWIGIYLFSWFLGTNIEKETRLILMAIGFVYAGPFF